MTLSDLAIKKPVFAWMLMGGLILFGSISFFQLGISQLPDVDFPVLTITTTWTGASPESIEAAVTDPIEDAVMSVDGIKNISSSCQEGVTNTSIEFELNRNIDSALQEVQSKIAQAQKSLPIDIDPPVISKSNPEDQPIMWTALTGGKDIREKILVTRQKLRDNLTTIQGVGGLRLGGYVEPNMRIWLNPEKMFTHQITIEDVMSTLRDGNVLAPSGYIENGPSQTNIRVNAEAKTPEDFANLVIHTRSGSPIFKKLQIKDVADVQEGVADMRRISRLNGMESIGMGVIKQRGSNAVSVAEAVKERFKNLKSVVPEGMKMHVLFDSTEFIKESTHELIFTLGLSAALTALVCYLFLGSFSSALNVVLAIPTSLIGTFIALSFFGFTLNTFTILALSLSIGIVVDDAIMVLENIVRHRELGLSRVEASLVGAREITGAAVAASLAILVIFIPVVFMKGIIGKFFYQFGITMSVAILLSLLEALTLAPMRCSQFLATPHSEHISPGIVDRALNGLTGLYRKGLRHCLRFRWITVLVSVIFFAASLTLLSGVRTEFSPSEDISRFMVIIQTPMGSSLQATTEAFIQVEKFFMARPEVETVYEAIGGFQGGLVNQGNMFVTLKKPRDRPIVAPFTSRPTQQDLLDFSRKSLVDLKGVTRITFQDISGGSLSSKRGFPIEVSLQGPDMHQLAESTADLMKKMEASGLMTDIDSDYLPNMPLIEVVPDQEKAALHGVSMVRISEAISTMMGGTRVGKYTHSSGRRDDVRVKLSPQFSLGPETIQGFWIRNNRGEMIRLSEVVQIRSQPSLLTINRNNRERTVTLFANIKSGASQSDAIAFMERTAKASLPSGYHLELSGGSQSFQESELGLLIALLLGVVTAYMVLGAQFNSFIHPISVLLAMPFSITGALVAVRLSGISINVYSMIGILLLMGIVKKNSILLVDFSNQIRASRSLPVHEALLEACPLRLRPILMTSIATVVAAIPPAFSIGAGSASTKPMAIVVIGGVLFSTLLTLFVVPCAYSILTRLENRGHQAEIDAAVRKMV